MKPSSPPSNFNLRAGEAFEFFDSHNRSPLGKTVSRLEFPFQERHLAILVAPYPVLRMPVRPTLMERVEIFGIEIKARHSVTVTKGSIRVNICSKMVARPIANLLRECGWDQKLEL